MADLSGINTDYLHRNCLGHVVSYIQVYQCKYVYIVLETKQR